MPCSEDNQRTCPHLKAFFVSSAVDDLTSKSGIEIGERIESLDIGEDLRKLERRIIAEFGPGFVALFADFANFWS